jgi:hypothetical protein
MRNRMSTVTVLLAVLALAGGALAAEPLFQAEDLDLGKGKIQTVPSEVFDAVSKSLTLEFTVTLDTLKAKRQAVVWKTMKSNKSNKSGFYFQFLNGKPLFGFYDVNNDQQHIYGEKLQKAELGRPLHFVCVYDGASMSISIYKNGVLDGKNPEVSTAIKPNSMDVGLAGYRGSDGSIQRELKGTLHSVTIRDKADPPGVGAVPGEAIHTNDAPIAHGGFIFDMEHDEDTTFPGSIRVTVDDLWGPGKDVGWGSTDPDRTIEFGRALVGRPARPRSAHVDILTRDLVFWRGNEDVPLVFRARVPDGRYLVRIYSGFPFSPDMYDFRAYTVKANGEEKAGQAFNKDTMRKRYWQGFGPEYEPTPDWTEKTVWEKYIRNVIIREHDFEATAKDGVLEIEFNMPYNGGPRQRGQIHSILPINAIVAVPASDRKTALRSLEEVERKRFDHFAAAFELLQTPMQQLPPLPEAARERGYVPFVRTVMERIYPTSNPVREELDAPLDLAVARNERGIATFGVKPLRRFDSATVSIGRLRSDFGAVLPAEAVRLYDFRYMLQPTDYRRRAYRFLSYPKLMIPTRPRPWRPDMARGYVLEVEAAPGVEPGLYTGNITFAPEGGVRTTLPVRVRVYPFDLETYPDDDERVWLYRLLERQYLRYGPPLFENDEVFEYVERDFRFMKSRGIAPTIAYDYFLPMETFVRIMDLYTEIGFGRYAVYGGIELISEIRKAHGPKGDKQPVFEPFLEKIEEVAKEVEKHPDWPPVAFYTTAEVNRGLPSYLDSNRFVSLIKQRVPEAVTIMLPQWIEEARTNMESESDIIGPNAISMTEEISSEIRDSDKKLWFYAWGRERFRCGLADWRLRSRGAVREYYAFTVQRPFNMFDGKFHDGFNDSPPFIGPDGPVSTPGMEETSLGRNDFKYLATVELWLERALAEGLAETHPAVRRTRGFLETMEERIVPDYNHYYRRKREMGFQEVGGFFQADTEKVFKWKNEEYNQMRSTAAGVIVALKKAVGR